MTIYLVFLDDTLQEIWSREPLGTELADILEGFNHKHGSTVRIETRLTPVITINRTRDETPYETLKARIIATYTID